MSGSHRRFNPLTGRHVLVSPHRATRPWQGQEEMPEAPTLSRHDAHCHLCPGNLRASGERNPDYQGSFVFDNDFPALTAAAAPPPTEKDELFRAIPARGLARVICYSPDHGATLADLSLDEIVALIDAWCEQSAALGTKFAHVQIFENKGAMMGASSPHPHGQIWATDYLPDEIAVEDQCQRDWLARTGHPLLLDLAECEASNGDRIVAGNERWLAIVPYWAGWPFETLVLPRFQLSRLPDLEIADRHALAQLLRELVIRYDNLFQAPFPYSMGWHEAPDGGTACEGWQLHAHFYPPLLRSASVRKFMVGFELLAEVQRDLTPEDAAAKLRAVGSSLYRAARS
jgi:UDPglucose--hexose-1-phosphate uridylyltransferase